MFVHRTRICEAIVRSIIFKIEREQTQESMKKRLKTPTTTATTTTSTSSIVPKPDHRKLALTRLLTERIDTLRQEFIGNRLNRKSVLVKEQVQTQRLKQQQQTILKQQQATSEKDDEEAEQASPDAHKNKSNSPAPPAKKPRKSVGNETKKTPKVTSEQKTKR